MQISYGFELELSDVSRTTDIPERLGRWEGPKEGGYYMGAEIDIVNTLGQNRGIASDPLCETCKVGGEINVSPSSSMISQFCKVFDIINLFPHIGNGHVNHFHVHTYFKELEDLDAIKRLIKYTIENEHSFITATYLQNWHTFDFSRIASWGRSYLLQDGGRYLNENIHTQINDVTSFDELKTILNQPSHYYDAIPSKLNSSIHTNPIKCEATSIRTAINFSNLIKNKTLEFRSFRSTLCYSHIVSQLLFVTRFIEEGVSDSKNKLSVVELLHEHNYEFAPLQFNEELQLGWEATRHSKGRGDKYKYYYDAGMPVTDDCSENGQYTYNKALSKVL